MGAQFDVARAIRVHHKADLRRDCLGDGWKADQKPFDYADGRRPLSDEVKRWPSRTRSTGGVLRGRGLAGDAPDGDDGSLGSVRRRFISAAPIAAGSGRCGYLRTVRPSQARHGALPDRQTSLVSGLEGRLSSAPSVTFVGTKRRHVAGAMTNTHAVRMPGAPRRRRGPGRPTASDPSSPSTGSRTRARTSSAGGGAGNLHSRRTRDGRPVRGQPLVRAGPHGGACGTLVGGGGYPTDGGACFAGDARRRAAKPSPTVDAPPAHPWRATARRAPATRDCSPGSPLPV